MLKWWLSDYYNCLGQFHLRRRGKGVMIHHTVKIDHPQNVEILENSRIDKNGRLRGRGDIMIWNNTQIAEDFFCISENHNDFKIYAPYKERFKKKIVIGNNVWIGANVTILGGTVLQDGCVVGAGSVVRGQFKKNELIIGNPAKVVKNLGKKRIIHRVATL